MRRLRVLVGCECSGRVRDAFAARNWEAWSADLLPSETPVAFTVFPDGHAETQSGDDLDGAFHYQGDVRDLFDLFHPVNRQRRYGAMYAAGQGTDRPLWNLFIGHPPCDHLALAGARWWPAKRADGRQDAAAAFFMEMTEAPAPYVAVENPVGDMKRRYRAPDQVIQPWFFGDPFEKATCLWLKNLPALEPTHVIQDYADLARVTTGGGSWRTDKAAAKKNMSAYEDSEGRANRAKVRSRTFNGLAREMARQWGSYIEQEEAA